MGVHVRRRWDRLGALLGLLAIVTFGLTACGPEADRSRGGGPGADVGNRGDPVELQGSEPTDARIYYQTPRDTPAIASE